jgi:DNA-binding CsgD family transcriptional regulator
LRHELRPRLLRLLSFDAYCVNTCDLVSGLVTSSVGDGLCSDDARLLFELEARGGDFNSLRELALATDSVRGLSLSTGGDPQRSQRMREIFIPLGFADELRAALCVDRVCYGYLHLFRRPERGSFDAQDLAQVRGIAPSIAYGLRAALRRALGGVPGAQREASILVMDAADRVIRESPGATARLAPFDTTQSGLAHVVRATAAEARHGRSARATAINAHVGRVNVRALSLGPETAVILDDTPDPNQRRALLHTFGLTPREVAVAELVCAGHSNAELGAELGIALHTAKDHLKAILRKTECSSRAKLIARLRAL